MEEGTSERRDQGIGQIVRHFNPETPTGKDFHATLWQEPPYPHERLLIDAWIRASEKEQLGQDFLDNLVVLWRWLSSRRRRESTDRRPQGRETPPPLLYEEGRFWIRAALEELQKPEFSRQRNAQEQIRQSLRMQVSLLVERRVLKRGHEGENTIDYLKRLEGEVSGSVENPSSP